MAHQVNPLRTLVTDEFKEINTENYEDYFDKAQEEVARLKVENTELLASNEKLTKKLVKKKNELEIEKTNSNTFRLYIQELNAKVQQLERAAPPFNSPTIHPVQNPILNTVINEEFVERLVIEKSGFESQIFEQKREIELLNSELISCKGELTNKTESQANASALAQEVTKLETDILLKIQQLEESNSYSLKLEAECKLGKQLFQDALNSISAEKEEIQQQLDRERGLNEKLHLDIEQLNNLNELQNSKLTEHLKEMDTSQSNEDKLQMNQLENENTQLKDDAHILSAKIEEQNLQLHLKSNKIRDLSQQNLENAQIIEDLTSEKSKLEERIEELKEENKKLTLELTENPEKVKLIAELENANDQIVKIKQISLANQEKLKVQINQLENENTQLKDDARILSAKIEEQNLQLIESKQSQQNNEKTQILIETKEKQISDLKMQILDQQAKEQTNQTQVEKQIKELNEELEQLKSDYTDLQNFFKSENEKFLILETGKHTLEEVIDTLIGEIEKLTESKKENEQNIKELESSFEKLTNESKALEIQLEESKNEFNKLQEKGEEYYQNSQQQIDVLKTELETAMNELKINRKNSGISKLLITKLNSEIMKLQERQLLETERTRIEMATEIANRDSKIQILNQDITILQNKGQVAQATPTQVMPSNQSKQKEDKKLVQKLSKDSKQKHTDTSGATPGATLSELTPQIIPVANRSGKSSTKIAFRPGMSVNTVKLKSLPNLAEHQGKQVIYQMNKRYELGILMVLFEAPTKLGMRNVTVKYAGIKLHNPVGNCSGEFRTKRLFDCEQNYGIFVPYEDVLVPVV